MTAALTTKVRLLYREHGYGTRRSCQAPPHICRLAEVALLHAAHSTLGWPISPSRWGSRPRPRRSCNQTTWHKGKSNCALRRGLWDHEITKLVHPSTTRNVLWGPDSGGLDWRQLSFRRLTYSACSGPHCRHPQSCRAAQGERYSSPYARDPIKLVSDNAWRRGSGVPVDRPISYSLVDAVCGVRVSVRRPLYRPSSSTILF